MDWEGVLLVSLCSLLQVFSGGGRAAAGGCRILIQYSRAPRVLFGCRIVEWPFGGSTAELYSAVELAFTQRTPQAVCRELAARDCRQELIDRGRGPAMGRRGLWSVPDDSEARLGHETDGKTRLDAM
jgi:hypothetical protein